MRAADGCMTVLGQPRFSHDRPHPHRDTLGWRMSSNRPFQRGCLVTQLTALVFRIGGCTYA